LNKRRICLVVTREESAMRPKEEQQKDTAEKAVSEIHRATGWRFSAEEKIRIVLEGRRGEAGGHCSEWER
jgi:hypothetical protein